MCIIFGTPLFIKKAGGWGEEGGGGGRGERGGGASFRNFPKKGGSNFSHKKRGDDKMGLL